jgi:hypothetical protein
MPLPQGLGAVVPLPPSTSAPSPVPTTPAPHPFPVPSSTQAGGGGDRERMERERWGRMDVLYQSIRNNARQFEYPAASVAALESVLVRMYFESPISALQPQPHPAYAATLAQAAPQQQPENGAVSQGDQSDNTSESEDDDDEE